MRFPTDNDPEEMQWLGNLSNLETKTWKTKCVTAIFTVIHFESKSMRFPTDKVPEKMQWLENLSNLGAKIWGAKIWKPKCENCQICCYA